MKDEGKGDRESGRTFRWWCRLETFEAEGGGRKSVRLQESKKFLESKKVWLGWWDVLRSWPSVKRVQHCAEKCLHPWPRCAQSLAASNPQEAWPQYKCWWIQKGSSWAVRQSCSLEQKWCIFMATRVYPTAQIYFSVHDQGVAFPWLPWPLPAGPVWKREMSGIHCTSYCCSWSQGWNWYSSSLLYCTFYVILTLCYRLSWLSWVMT